MSFQQSMENIIPELDSMLICVDVGNTNIVIGIFKGEKLISTFRLETKVLRTEDEYGLKIIDNLTYLQLKPSDIDGVIISSVVPEIDTTLEHTFKKYFNLKPLFVEPGVKTGIKVKIDNPKQLGADLLVGAVASVNKYGAPCIVIDMGTATTISLVNENKEFLGGIIYPGIIPAFQSLIKSTSLLEAAKIGIPNNIIGRDTNSSIQSGMIYGTAGAINGIVKRIFDEYGKMKVVITGGMSHYIIPYLDFNPIYDDNLLMDGLYMIYQKNCKNL